MSVYMLFIWPLLFPKPVAFDATEKEGLVILEPKLGPVICQLVVAVEAPPHELVVPSALACAAKRKVHAIHVLGPHALRLNVQVTLLIRYVGIRVVHCGGQAPTALESEMHSRRRREV